MNIESILPFLKEIDRLKTVERQTLIHSGGRRENSAEHSWHLAMAVLFFEKLAPQKLDVCKAMKMALLHDVVEVYAGDTIVYGDLSNKKVEEAEALKKLSQLLPEELRADFENVWLEFEEGQCAEAKFVSAIDRFLPLYSNYLNGGHSWKSHQISTQRVIAKCEPPISEGFPPLWEVARKMIEESIQRGDLSSDVKP